MSRFTVHINIDSDDPEPLMEFWIRVLGYQRRGSSGPYISAADPDGTGPLLVIQRVPEIKTVKNRLHLDLYAPDYAAWQSEVERAISLGATMTPNGLKSEGDEHWVVLEDPQGNEFCICYEATST